MANKRRTRAAAPHADDYIDDCHGLARRKTPHTGAHIRVPAPPPIATREDVNAEIMRNKAADRLLVRQARWKDTSGGHGIVEPDTPAVESERALDVPPRPSTPRGAPISMRLERTTHGMRIVTRYG